MKHATYFVHFEQSSEVFLGVIPKLTQFSFLLDTESAFGLAYNSFDQPAFTEYQDITATASADSYSL